MFFVIGHNAEEAYGPMTLAEANNMVDAMDAIHWAATIMTSTEIHAEFVGVIIDPQRFWSRV
jgi:hypothetical protein